VKLEKIEIHTEEISLDNFLKWANIVSSGGQAKHLISEGYIKVNGETEIRRSRKLVKGDIIDIQDDIRLKVT